MLLLLAAAIAVIGGAFSGVVADRREPATGRAVVGPAVRRRWL